MRGSIDRRDCTYPISRFEKTRPDSPKPTERVVFNDDMIKGHAKTEVKFNREAIAACKLHEEELEAGHKEVTDKHSKTTHL